MWNTFCFDPEQIGKSVKQGKFDRSSQLYSIAAATAHNDMLLKYFRLHIPGSDGPTIHVKTLIWKREKCQSLTATPHYKQQKINVKVSVHLEEVHAIQIELPGLSEHSAEMLFLNQTPTNCGKDLRSYIMLRTSDVKDVP